MAFVGNAMMAGWESAGPKPAGTLKRSAFTAFFNTKMKFIYSIAAMTLVAKEWATPSFVNGSFPR
tara:strand:+ start:188 stop:382 length:195 start_codon:yes stop_codon:yes gene_type:complete